MPSNNLLDNRRKSLGQLVKLNARQQTPKRSTLPAQRLIISNSIAAVENKSCKQSLLKPLSKRIQDENQARMLLKDMESRAKLDDHITKSFEDYYRLQNEIEFIATNDFSGDNFLQMFQRFEYEEARK